MTAHDHRTYVPGCFRCDLSRDEVARAAMTREQAIDAMLAVAPCDWWRFVTCRDCRADRGDTCRAPGGRARDPHADRRRTGLVLHGTLWLLDRGFVGDVLGWDADSEALSGPVSDERGSLRVTGPTKGDEAP